MVLTKELAAKGAAILGSAGAGGTGLYYGGHYVSGLVEKNATALKQHMAKDENNNVTFDIFQDNAELKKIIDVSESKPETVVYSDTLDFSKSTSFVVKAVSSSLTNTEVSNIQGGSQNIDSNSALSCSFKFEVDNNSNKTIKQDY